MDVFVFQLGLQLHHSELSGRKINVEFTSSGTKNEKRMEGLKLKNTQAARFRMIPSKGKKK